ncbi:MAG: nucleotidyltransferase substrate binding protein [Treponema sp.]|nr:nucleotidyltransferase substrate binding protein [Treponema sp.]
MKDIRWKQHFQNYKKALLTLENAVELAGTRELSDLEKQGMIKGFEFTFEMAWNLMKDYLEEEGVTGIMGSKGAIRHAFNSGLIDDGQIWIDMLNDRNLASHTHDVETANNLVNSIMCNYILQFNKLKKKMESFE